MNDNRSRKGAETMKNKTLYNDAYCRIFEAQGRIHILHKGDGYIQTPSKISLEYRGFTARDFSDLRRELAGSGIPEGVARRWVEQAQTI